MNDGFYYLCHYYYSVLWVTSLQAIRQLKKLTTCTDTFICTFSLPTSLYSEHSAYSWLSVVFDFCWFVVFLGEFLPTC